ncbi:ornithine cyclodeaminase [Paxillus involutus ATCC 200175]|nr:ornithine cyclodeaminase [Paxillus involutus ATCC 200175]
MSLLVLSAEDVSAVTSELKLEELEALMASVFHRLSSGSDYASPHRTSISMPRHTTLFMPSRVPDLGTTIKVVSVPMSGGDKQGLPASTIVLDETTGCVKAIVNASTLTALRTASGSVLATRLLISKLPKTLLAFGAGQQINAHVDLHFRAFPSLESCIIVNRANNTRLQNLLSTLRRSHPFKTFEILTLDDEQLRDAVAKADIICTATSSTKPLFSSEWVSPGTHLNLVGSFTPHMHEIDSTLINRAGKVVVDSRDACAIEAGELITAGKADNPKESMIELGELVEKGEDGKYVPVTLPGGVKGSDGVTIFKSVGVGLQDVAIASLVVSRAKQMGYGTSIDNYH